MKKVLIYFQEEELAPTGGPKGYLYNLKNQLDKMSDLEIEISFIKNGRERINKYKRKIEEMKSGKLKKVLVITKRIIKHFLLVYGKKHYSLVDLGEYDYIHFHSTLDMYSVRDSLKNYKGKVILSSHSPMVLSKEILDSISDFEKKVCGFIYDKLIKMDEYAFNNSDYLIFPCEEAEEPYYHTWKEYKKIKEKNKQKYRYLLTGIQECQIKIDKRDIRKKYNIPQDAFVISYVGRHNAIKGYDLFTEICSSVIKEQNVYVLVAGTEGPIMGLQDEKWIRVGWTKDPHSIINASDVFILPNRETYFDLILLEVLSIGKIIIASYTGGNKYFNNQKYGGIFLYNSISQATNEINKIKNMSKKERQQLEKSNHTVYETEFSAKIFAENYIKLLSTL